MGLILKFGHRVAYRRYAGYFSYQKACERDAHHINWVEAARFNRRDILFNYICTMNQRIQNKIARYKKMADNSVGSERATHVAGGRADSLGQVIRSKKEADEFLAELEAAVKRAK